MSNIFNGISCIPSGYEGIVLSKENVEKIFLLSQTTSYSADDVVAEALRIYSNRLNMFRLVEERLK